MREPLVCPICCTEIPAGDPVAFLGDQVLHLDCFLKIRKPGAPAPSSKETIDEERREEA